MMVKDLNTLLVVWSDISNFATKILAFSRLRTNLTVNIRTATCRLLV